MELSINGIIPNVLKPPLSGINSLLSPAPRTCFLGMILAVVHIEQSTSYVLEY